MEVDDYAIEKCKYLLDDNSAGDGDSYTGTSFAAEVGPLFGKRTVAVIKGKGDDTSLTGE